MPLECINDAVRILLLVYVILNLGSCSSGLCHAQVGGGAAGMDKEGEA